MQPTIAVLLALAAGYALVVALVALQQHRLLYLPTRAPLAAMLGPGLAPWPNAADLRGLLREPAGPARGTALVLHGNAGHAGHRAHYADWLAAQGLRVVLVEYPGYGPREGAPGDALLVDDARRSIALARQTWGGPLLLVGESLGAGVAAAAAEAGGVDALLLITPWARLADVAAEHYPWLPVRRLLRDRYDSAAALAHYSQPVLLVLAEDDAVVPARHGLALHAALGAGPVRLLRLEGVGHNDWAARLDAAWWRAALDFLLPGAPRQDGAARS